MGYRCPVCGASQADAEHLANHLAFTAMLHGDDHEAWLDEHAPDWEEAGPGDLAPRVAELADETDHETVFDGSAGAEPADLESALARRTDRGRAPSGELQRVLEEAREMTEEMLGEE